MFTIETCLSLVIMGVLCYILYVDFTDNFIHVLDITGGMFVYITNRLKSTQNINYFILFSCV